MANSAHKHIAAHLKALPKADAAAFAKQVAAVQKAGLKSIRIFPKGIPAFDTVVVSGLVRQAELAALIGKLAVNIPKLGGIEVFPYGIPAIDTFNVNVNLK
jgi:hypothetical protein